MRGSVKRRGKGSWSIRYDLPQLSNQRRKQARVTIRGTKAEAERTLAKLLAESWGRPQAASGTIDVATYLGQWIDGKDHAATLADSVLVTYRQRIDDYLIPTLGRIALHRLTADDIERAVGFWRTMPRRDRKTGQRSDRTVKHVFDLLRKALNDARRRGRISHNPCLDLDPPQAEDPDVATIDETEAEVLLAGFADRIELQLGGVVKVTTGVRRGELCALDWTDVDEASGFLVVRKKCIKKRDGSWAIVEGSKTTRKARRVPMMSSVQGLLTAYRELQRAGFALVGLSWSPSISILTTPDGKTLTPDQFSSAFSYICRARGLPTVSLHGLRHSFTSIGGSANIPLEVRSEILGHSSIVITHDVYNKVHDRVKSAAANQLESILGKAVEVARATGRFAATKEQQDADKRRTRVLELVT